MNHYLPTAMNEFLEWRQALQTKLELELAYIDLCRGDHLAGIVLSRIVDELARARAGDRPWVLEDDDVWMPIPYSEWYATTRVRRRQAQRVLKKLNVEFRYIDTAVKAVGHGQTAAHVHLREHRFLEVWHDLLQGNVPDADTQDPEI